jgi:O-antigen ligase
MVNFITGIITLFSQVSFGQFIALALVMITAVFVLVYSYSQRTFYLTKTNMRMLVLWLLIIVSLLRIENLFHKESIIELSWLSLGVIFILISLCNFKTDIYQYRKNISLVTLFFSLIVLVGYVLNSDFFGLINYPYAGVRLVGGFDGPNEIAGFYLIFLGLMLGWLYFDQNEGYKLLIWMSILVAVIIIILSYSRGGLLGLELILASVLIYSIWVSIKRKKIKRLLLTLLVGTLLFYVILYQIYPMLEITRKQSTSRIPVISESINLIKQKPFFGHGIGGFAIYGDSINNTPHNGLLFFLVSGGMISFLLFFLFYSNLVVICLKKRLYPEFFFFIVFLYQEMFFNNLIRGRLSFLFWICTLYVLKYTNSRPNSKLAPVTKKVA